MIIEQIELYNFGSYEDRNLFHLASDDPSKRIVIVGGKTAPVKQRFLPQCRSVSMGISHLDSKQPANDI